ncbi:MAG TPA: branched-chain amino acid ABC transporter permease [Burkholderiales bacterium]|nr:branched-chain amino acid ABC transporter permease [Burkholderiales bacterium]
MDARSNAKSRELAALASGAKLSRSQLVGLALALLAAFALPWFISDYRNFQFTLAISYAMAVLGLNILVGYNGQFSLGHAAFYAIGAYTAAIMMEQGGFSYYWTIPVAGLVCLVAGFLFGLPALRLEGLYLALATFALSVATPQMLKYDAISPWTGGVQGVSITKPDPPFGLPISQDQWLYLFSLAVMLVLFVCAWNMLRGRTGRALKAIRDNPIAASAMGVDTALYKSLTFGVSALYTGIAGALGAIAIQFVAPDTFNFFLSIAFLVGVVIGGLASIPGAVFGGLVIVFIPNFAEQVSKAAPWAIYGAVLILFMYFMPAGIWGFIRMLYAWFTRKRGGESDSRAR